MSIDENHIDNRIEWIKEDSEQIRKGDIKTHVFDTRLKSSRLSQLAAGEIPFLKAKVTAEKILFVDFPVESDYIDRIYVSQPMFTGITGLGCKDYPVQVGCVTDYKLPNSIAVKRQKRKNMVFVSSKGSDDLFLKQIFKDGKLSTFQWVFMHIINKDERIGLEYGLQVMPPIEVFGNKTLCTLSSGTFRKTLRAYGRRVYDFNNYFQWLENTVRNLKELSYSGPVNDTGVYDSIFFIFHDGLADLKKLDGTLVCPECGTKNAPDYKYCLKCGVELKKRQ